ncbi:beta-ketoacyl synthase chain length factor [Psychromonas sp.]|uniref:beta-ketoacyl synthase chain length factor n=1 Tax=Psychromonas sp. TaxID=1884585 RepID=UPI0035697372
MKAIAFNIKNWFAISPGIESQDAWRCWSEQHCLWPNNASKLQATLIPPMLRRRMSSLSKVAVQAAMQISQDQQFDYIIFTSRHGELTRTVSLLEDIIKGEDASPMAFSQSVHNTAAGLFTIASKRATPVTSIASGENGLSGAIIESYCYLCEHPTHQVLVVDFDEPLPDLYQQYETQDYQSYALAMLIESGDRYTLSSTPALTDKLHPHPHALQLINWLVSDKKFVDIKSQNKCWQWREKDDLLSTH